MHTTVADDIKLKNAVLQ